MKIKKEKGRKEEKKEEKATGMSFVKLLADTSTVVFLWRSDIGSSPKIDIYSPPEAEGWATCCMTISHV
jgi:hypothetical protein